MRDTKSALRWIVSLLETTHVPFQIVGGFATHLYGSSRKIADIDIAIPEEAFDILLPIIKPFITFGPGHYKDAEWDMQLITLSYEGQEIDLAGHMTKIFDRTEQKWVLFPVDFSASEYREIYGVTIPLMPKKALIGYKKMLGRAVDKVDVLTLEKQ